MKFGRCLGSSAAEKLAKFQSNWKIVSTVTHLQGFARSYHKMHTRHTRHGVGVLKPIFVGLLFSKFFRLIKTLVTCCKSHSCLTGVATAVKYQCDLKNKGTFTKLKISLMEKIRNGALVTPTSESVKICREYPYCVCGYSWLVNTGSYSSLSVCRMMKLWVKWSWIWYQCLNLFSHNLRWHVMQPSIMKE